MNRVEYDYEVSPQFQYPSKIERKPPFRFLDVPKYWEKYGERADIPEEAKRQDGIYLIWDSERIRQELIETDRVKFKDEIVRYNPKLYAFLPYHSTIYKEINEILTGVTNRRHLSAGLMLSVNRQRLADEFPMAPTRFEQLSRNLFVVLHFDDAKPDQGRKTLQDEVLDLSRRAADRALQYIAKHRQFLKPAGDAPTPGQREVERNHEEWKHNVIAHAKLAPLHIRPVAYISEPLVEQDVVGLFHQLASLGVFPGLQIYATSQSHTYDCLVKFECRSDMPSLRYHSMDSNPLGMSSYVLGDIIDFETRSLTLEFKNNLDGLIDDITGESKKEFNHIDICVCWSQISEGFKGFELEQITEGNLDARKYPGVTHILRRDGAMHVVQVIMLKEVTELIDIGRITFSSHIEVN